MTAKKPKSGSSTAEAPWDKPNPKPAAKAHHLTPAQKASAKRAAKKAGRPYPNLVDNMHAAAGHKGKGKAKD